MSENTPQQDILYSLMDMFSDMVAEKVEQRLKDAKTEPLQDNTTFTPIEAAKYIGVSRESIYKLVRSGELPSFRPTKQKIFIYKAELDKWIGSGGCA